MKAILVDFASQNQPKWPSFIILFCRRRRRISFETASEGICERTAGLKPAVHPSQRGQAAPAKQIAGSFETAPKQKKRAASAALN
jgi:hypothetical protein